MSGFCAWDTKSTPQVLLVLRLRSMAEHRRVAWVCRTAADCLSARHHRELHTSQALGFWQAQQRCAVFGFFVLLALLLMAATERHLYSGDALISVHTCVCKQGTFAGRIRQAGTQTSCYSSIPILRYVRHDQHMLTCILVTMLLFVVTPVSKVDWQLL
jgi:hypothetical protein